MNERLRGFAELAGLAALTAGIFIEHGLGWALIAFGAAVLACSFVGRLREKRDDRSAADTASKSDT